MSEAQRNATAQALLLRCAARDAHALEKLYELVAPLLFGLLLRMLRRRAVAEEALQDVFISIWQRAGQYRSERGSALPWLIGMTRNRAIDLLRHERTAPVLMPEPPESELAAEATEAPPEPAGMIEHCLGQLSNDQQQCLQFAYVNGRSHQEIAQLTRTPLGTVKSWIRRALVSLRECLES